MVRTFDGPSLKGGCPGGEMKRKRILAGRACIQVNISRQGELKSGSGPILWAWTPAPGSWGKRQQRFGSLGFVAIRWSDPHNDRARNSRQIMASPQACTFQTGTQDALANPRSAD